MENLEMTPDDFEQLQRLMLKLNCDLNKVLKYASISNLNGQTHTYYFLSDLNNLINANKKALNEDLFMNIFQLQIKLAK